MVKNTSKKLKILLLVILLLIFAAADYAFIIKKNPVKAPIKEEASSPQGNANEQNLTPPNNFDYKGQENKVAVNQSQNPNDPNTYYDLGNAEFSNKNYQEAIKNFDKAIEMNSTSPKFYIRKSEVQIVLNNKEAAISTINQGLSKNPNDQSLLSQLDFINNAIK